MDLIFNTFKNILASSFVSGLLFICFVGFVVFSLYVLFRFFRRPWMMSKQIYPDPQRILIFGRPGQGKTTLLVYKMIEELRQGKIVVSNQSIKWFGAAFRLQPLHRFINNAFRFVFLSRFYSSYFSRVTENLNFDAVELQRKIDNLLDDDGFMLYDPTLLRKNLFHIEQERDSISKFIELVEQGVIFEYEYPASNFIYMEDLEDAIAKIIGMSIEDRSRQFVLAWDEGFAYLDAGKKVPEFITNFFNQSRKLDCTCLIASQRPVAVYPSFRALTDFMVLVRKGWFSRFKSFKYYVDSSENALPDLDGINSNRGFFSFLDKNSDKGESYIHYKGRDVFYYFDSRQSFALQSLLDKYISGKM